MNPLEITAACGGELVAGPGEGVGPTRAVADSRQVRRGDLFVGLKGARADGGRFAEEALAAGAWGVMVTSDRARELAGSGTGGRLIGVADPCSALAELACAWRLRLNGGACRVVGITGSTGKTSVKDIATALLEPHFHVHASPRNLNTEVGLPLAILEAEADCEVLVLEMAMRGVGQIRQLAGIGLPQIAVITNVGPAHLGLMGTVENVARAKAELIASLPAGGSCVIPHGLAILDPYLRGDIRTVRFADAVECASEQVSGSPDVVEKPARASKGSGGGGPADAEDGPASISEPAPETIADSAYANKAYADVALVSETVKDGGSRIIMDIGGEEVEFVTDLVQRFNLVNLTTAAALAWALGVAPQEIPAGASEVRISGMRGELVDLPGGASAINDCYNANPMSMRAALEYLAAAAGRAGARRVAVLGHMAELGPEAPAFHRRVGELAARAEVEVLVAVGGLANDYIEGFGDAGERYLAADADEAAGVVRELILPGDLVLVKGSRSVGLERVVGSLASVTLGEAR